MTGSVTHTSPEESATGDFSHFVADEMNQNGMDLLAEFDAYGNTIAEYTHGHAEIDGVGSMVAAKKTDYGDPMFPVTYYQYPIYNGPTCDVMALVDENGNVVGDYEYDAWGNRLHAAETGAPNRFGYRCNWITLPDSNGEIIITPTRLYHAPTGRFLQVDVLPELVRGRGAGHLVSAMVSGRSDQTTIGVRAEEGDAASNGYAFVKDSPASGADPSGLADEEFVPIPAFPKTYEDAWKRWRAGEKPNMAAENAAMARILGIPVFAPAILFQAKAIWVKEQTRIQKAKMAAGEAALDQKKEETDPKKRFRRCPPKFAEKLAGLLAELRQEMASIGAKDCPSARYADPAGIAKDIPKMDFECDKTMADAAKVKVHRTGPDPYKIFINHGTREAVLDKFRESFKTTLLHEMLHLAKYNLLDKPGTKGPPAHEGQPCAETVARKLRDCAKKAMK